MDLTTSVTKAYGDTTATAVQHVADLSILAVRLGKTTIPVLSDAISKAAPTMAGLGVSVDETYAALSSLTGVTGPASVVSTQLRMLAMAFLKPNKDMVKALKDLGYANGESAVKALGFVGAMRAVASTTDGTATALSKLFTGKGAVGAVLALTTSQADTFDERLKTMRSSAGSLDKAFADMTQGIDKSGFTYAQFKESLHTLGIELGDSLAPALAKIIVNLKPLIKGVKALIEWFAKLPPGAQNAIIGFLAITAALGPVLSGLGRFITLVGGVVKAWPLLLGAGRALVPAFAGIRGAVAGINTACQMFLGGSAVASWVGSLLQPRSGSSISSTSLRTGTPLRKPLRTSKSSSVLLSGSR